MIFTAREARFVCGGGCNLPFPCAGRPYHGTSFTYDSTGRYSAWLCVRERVYLVDLATSRQLRIGGGLWILAVTIGAHYCVLHEIDGIVL
jgi:hypothetical protein